MTLTKAELLELTYIVSKYHLEIEQLVSPYDLNKVVDVSEAMRTRERQRVKDLLTKIETELENAPI